MKVVQRKVLAVLLMLPLCGVAMVRAEPLDAVASDPSGMGWMQGFPPPEDRIIGHPASDYFSFPKLRWTFCHFREIQATKRVGRGMSAVSLFTKALDSAIDNVAFTPIGGKQEMTWKASLDANYTDGMMILHRGEIVYEYYSGCLDREGRHGAMSVTKSFVGTVAEILIAEGALDDTKLVSEYVPELKPSGFGNATVREVMDMTTGLDYKENYADPESDIWQYAVAGARGAGGTVIVEGFVDFDYEITLLTVRHRNGTSFCAPIGHRQEGGDYQESWQPQPMSAGALAQSQSIAETVTTALGGWGLFGVEFFIKGDNVYFSEVSPRPHDTGMVTLISQDLSEFALHALAILGLPIPSIRQLGPAASAVVLAHGHSKSLSFSGLEQALAESDTQLRLFGKPEVAGKRRVGVALALADSLTDARLKAQRSATAVTIDLG